MANIKRIPISGNGGAATVDDIMLHGVTIKQAAVIFHIHNTELGNLVAKAGIAPAGTRKGANIYQIKDIAAVCVPPIWTDEEWEQVLHRGHFPATLKKDFWAARKARLSYLIEAGEYWHTSQVISAVSEIKKSFATSIKLIPDAVDRLTTLTVEQKSALIALLDESLTNTAKQIVEKFGENIEDERKQRFEEVTGASVAEDDGLGDI